MNAPKISVIMCTYNRSNLLARMLESILKQDFCDFELLLINNGSTDNTDEICERYSTLDNRIRILKIEKNNGPSAARNLGIEKAKSEYLCLVDDDDFCEINHLSTLYSLVEKHHVDIAITGCVDEYDNEIISKYNYSEEYIWNKEQAVSEFLKREKFHTAPATKLFRKNLFHNVKFIPNVRVDDIHIIYKLFVNANSVAAKGLPTYRFYKHSNNMTGFIETDKLSPVILNDYLSMQQGRIAYISKHLPLLTEQVKYAAWSYMISMIEKIETGKSEGCESQYAFMLEHLRKNKEAFLKAEWITQREKNLMIRYVL